MEYTIHDVLWTDEKVGRFWDYENNVRKDQNNWFTLQVGDAIWNFTKKHIRQNAKILDYGAGKGYLSRYILEKAKRITVDCAEFSEKGQDNIRQLLSNHPRFGRVIPITTFPIGVNDGAYDAIYFIEAIEHLTEGYFLPTLQELKRLTKPGGMLIITTDNDENFAERTVHCPDCLF